jgi:hypothetical protein
MVSEKTNGAWLNSATHDSMTEAATTSATVDAMSVRATLRLACGSVPSAVVPHWELVASLSIERAARLSWSANLAAGPVRSVTLAALIK